MKLVVGLGNPGNQYNFTRHNAGFLVLDFWMKLREMDWEKNPQFNAIWRKIRASELGMTEDVIAIKPQSYYNEVGKVVGEFMRYYKIALEDVVVVCDDFNLEFGKLRFRESGSAGGNNGLKSIIAELKSEMFPRLRIGTGNDELRKTIGDTDFVLGKFTTEEKAQLPTALRESVDRLEQIL